MEQQEVVNKLRRGELMLIEYLWRKKSILSKKEIIEAMKDRYKWRKSTTEILLKRLVKMKTLKKKRVGFQFSYEVLVTKKEYLNAIKEEKDINKYDNFFTQVFTTIHRKEEKTEEQIKVFIESMQKLGKK
ncbi:TPA: BlaI/MecI/CopY family transcriptional regulator [Clostridioides difficile]|uniref:BlaI/MecI/CopY family transcriptional regulator n=1 Tax=Clostridioides difficile TaxID=1496 RepID=UPI000D1D6571|nr:BlaI/MecI/CopY family transcriptional regulator [Clostridioides difficile]EII6780947.1 BlaI/MecI/CopY family transcriptional regulator [Clostridioides difficile]MBY2243149.1 BlaI/MecI/CopY family transcriptional regulator [Clostridioides difficile]MBY2485727.1 BlaI/MecI/CopY family transcriptional regulator [Clostridioides difficile]MCP3282610.1 BlaI/MecI/CopY family transcriptional regulator [Clostridioides difficile]MCW0565044.1 BlaI/MecI/CopY family transcriptional regulator [Clostridioi